MTNLKHYLPLKGLKPGLKLVTKEDNIPNRPVFIGLNLTSFDLNLLTNDKYQTSVKKTETLVYLLFRYKITYLCIPEKVDANKVVTLLNNIKEVYECNKQPLSLVVSKHLYVYLNINYKEDFSSFIITKDKFYKTKPIGVKDNYELWKSLVYSGFGVSPLYLTYPNFYHRYSYNFFGTMTKPLDGLVKIENKYEFDVTWFNMSYIENLINLRPQLLLDPYKLAESDGKTYDGSVNLKKLGISKLKGKIAIQRGCVGDYEVVNIFSLTAVELTLYPRYHYYLDPVYKYTVYDSTEGKHHNRFKKLEIELTINSTLTYILKKL